MLDMPSRSRVLLVSMPWAHHDMPSIQVAALQAYLHANGIAAEGAHWFVEVAHALGLENYRCLWDPALEDGEALYSYLLFPEMRARLLHDSSLRKKAATIARARIASSLRFELTERFFRRFERLHTRILDRYDWSDIALVGLTLNFAQTVASLYVAREIKKQNPACRIVVGGAEASGQLGASLLRHFPQLDFACNGEGEKPLVNLARMVLDGATDDAIATLPGITSRAADGSIRTNSPEQVRSMRELPIPEIGDYFAALERLGYESPHEVCHRVPVEASRGCYYSCTFCALNLQWVGMRTQSPERVAEMMRTYADRYQTLSFQYVDNVNPVNAQAIFDAVAADARDYRFFFELRTDTPRRVLESMQRAGLNYTQMGVEALSSSLLKTFNKRTKVIHNLQGMKNCAALGIRLTSNLIIDHPRSTEDDVKETLANMALARCYPPVEAISWFALEVGAPDFDDAAGGTIEITGNYGIYERVYPKRLLAELDLPRKAFRHRKRKANWQRVIDARSDWAKSYASVSESIGPDVPHLAYYDGGGFLRIEDFRSGELEVYVFKGIERDVYLAADQITSWNALRERLPHIPERRLRRELGEMVAAGVMFEEDDCYLSLAIAGRRSERGGFDAREEEKGEKKAEGREGFRQEVAEGESRRQHLQWPDIRQ